MSDIAISIPSVTSLALPRMEKIKIGRQRGQKRVLRSFRCLEEKAFGIIYSQASLINALDAIILFPSIKNLQQLSATLLVLSQSHIFPFFAAAIHLFIPRRVMPPSAFVLSRDTEKKYGAGKFPSARLTTKYER